MGFLPPGQGRCSIFHWAKKCVEVVSLYPARSGWVPETTRYKLVAAIIKIYATFGGSVFCSLLRTDSFSARSIALFIVRAELSSPLVLLAPAINPASTAFNFLLSPFTSSLTLLLRPSFETRLTFPSILIIYNYTITRSPTVLLNQQTAT